MLLSFSNLHLLTLEDIMVTFQVFDNYFSANIVLSRLQQEGINCYLRDEFSITIDPLLSNAAGGIKLMVSKQQYDEALVLMQQFEKDALQHVECPKCFQHTIEKLVQHIKPDWRVKLVRFFVPDFENDLETVYHCNNCGFETKTFPEKYAWYNDPE